jgi:hypothetical protein
VIINTVWLKIPTPLKKGLMPGDIIIAAEGVEIASTPSSRRSAIL